MGTTIIENLVAKNTRAKLNIGMSTTKEVNSFLDLGKITRGGLIRTLEFEILISHEICQFQEGGGTLFFNYPRNLPQEPGNSFCIFHRQLCRGHQVIRNLELGRPTILESWYQLARILLF